MTSQLYLLIYVYIYYRYIFIQYVAFMEICNGISRKQKLQQWGYQPTMIAQTLFVVILIPTQPEFARFAFRRRSPVTPQRDYILLLGPANFEVARMQSSISVSCVGSTASAVSLIWTEMDEPPLQRYSPRPYLDSLVAAPCLLIRNTASPSG